MIFLKTDHAGLNKFSGKDDENFALVLPEIRRMVTDGVLIVADRHRKKGMEQVGLYNNRTKHKLISFFRRH